MASLTTSAKAEGIALVLAQLVGSRPNVQYYDTYAKISFNPEQSAKLRTYVDSKLSSKQPSDVRIDLVSPLLPLALKYAIPAIVALLVGFLISKRRK